MDAEIHWLTKRGFAKVLGGNPHIKKVWIYEDVMNDGLELLNQEGYSRVFDMHCNLRTSGIRQKLKAKSIGFNKINVKKWLAVNLHWDVLPDKHIVDRYFEALELWGVENDEKGMDFFIQEKNVENLPQCYVVMAIGAAHQTKKMPFELIENVIEKMKDHVVLIGGPGDQELANRITERFPDKVSNLVGKCSIHQSADVMLGALRVISPDTGMMHIAAALQKPIDAVWGNTIPKFGMYPYYGKSNQNKATSHQVRLKCRPCSKIGFAKCPKGHFNCMRMQNSRTIAQSEPPA